VPGVAHHLVHGEEIRRVVQLLDELQLVRDARLDVGRHALRPAFRRRLAHPAGQGLLRRAARLQDLVRILVPQLVEAEARAGFEHPDRVADGIRAAREQSRHLGRALEAALAVALAREADRIHRPPEPDRGQHVGEASPGRMVVARVGGGQQPGPGSPRHGCERLQPVPVGPVLDRGRRAEQRQRQRAAERRSVGPHPRREGGIRQGRGNGRHHHASRMPDQVVAVDLAHALGRLHASQRQQPGQPAVAVAVRRPGEIGGAVREDEPRPDDEAQPDLLGRDMGTHRAGQAVQVADADPRMAEGGSRGDQLGRVRGAVQQRVVGPRAELGEGGRHARKPCRNQRTGWPGRMGPARPTQSRAPEPSATR